MDAVLVDAVGVVVVEVVVEVVDATVGADETLDDAVVGADESPELLHAASAASIAAAEAAAFHALLMAAPPFGDCWSWKTAKCCETIEIALLTCSRRIPPKSMGRT